MNHKLFQHQNICSTQQLFLLYVQCTLWLWLWQWHNVSVFILPFVLLFFTKYKIKYSLTNRHDRYFPVPCKHTLSTCHGRINYIFYCCCVMLFCSRSFLMALSSDHSKNDDFLILFFRFSMRDRGEFLSPLFPIG